VRFQNSFLLYHIETFFKEREELVLIQNDSNLAQDPNLSSLRIMKMTLAALPAYPIQQYEQ
jgi:hypothetical protein